MATSSKSPRERLDHLTATVGVLEDGFEDKFAQWSEKGHSSSAEYFLWTYEASINTIQEISAQKWKDDYDESLRPELDALVVRATQLPIRAEDYIKDTGYSLSVVHKGLLQALYRLSSWGDLDLNGLSMHTIHMSLRLRGIRPHPRSIWTQDESDIKPDEGFERIFKEFVDLEKRSHFPQEKYVLESHRLLQTACEALNIAGDEAYPSADFFSNERRPTFVEYPYGSWEFSYGKGDRPGILHLKSRLGALLSAEDLSLLGRSHEEVRKEAEKKERKLKKQQKKEEKKKIVKKLRIKVKNATGKDEQQQQQKKKKTTKRPRTTDSLTSASTLPPKKPKRPRTSTTTSTTTPRTPRTSFSATFGYAMTLVNAAADIEDLLRDSKYTELRGGDAPRPDSERLVTPTVEIRKATLVQYRDDLRHIIEEIFKRKFGMPTNKDKLPQTASERSAWLARATKELGIARASVHQLIDTANSPAKAKLLRLAAYRLKLVRAIYTLGLLSGDPPVEIDEVRDGLKARLQDWILYERAWNAAEKLTLKRAGLSNELYYTIRDQNRARKANIVQWKGMVKQLNRGPIPLPPKDTKPLQPKDTETTEPDDTDLYDPDTPKPTPKPRKDHTIYEDGGEPADDSGLYDDDDDEGTKKPEKPQEEQQDEQQDEQQEEEQEEEVEEEEPPEENPPDPGITLTDAEIHNGKRRLSRALHPRRPGSSRHYPPSPVLVNGAPVDIFAAGGPPGWENLPQNSVWARLQYMWVLTDWRFFQMRLLKQ
ncbi:hypothetical protein F5Y10DRAFT_200229 [Nemania abortiva]|nr:hypothetical protein F5Y10DRAFT_200229 [Nemania abortiva]